MRIRLVAALCLVSCGSSGELSFDSSAVDSSAVDSSAMNSSRAAPRASEEPQIAEYVVAAFEDTRGDLWFGTNGQGAARHRPATSPETTGELRYFSRGEGLIDDVVTGIDEDIEGRLWFGTHAGVSRFDPAEERATGRVTFTNFGSESGLRGDGCKLLVDRNGVLWVGSSAGVFRFDGERFHRFELPTPAIETPSYKMESGKIWDLFEDSRGNLWFARDGLGACKFDPSVASEPGDAAFTLFTELDGLCSNNVASIVEDPRGRIWFGSITSDHPQFIAKGGVSRFDPLASRAPGTPLLTQFPTLAGLTANDVYNLFVDRSGNVWIGAVGVGAYRCETNSDADHFTLFDRTDRPDLTRYFGIQAMVQDRHGTLWFGFSGGLFRFDGAAFVNVTRAGPWSSP
jgi:ligand-binding sensor domain-containing protein